jgi:pyrophosphatase PpaX
MNKIDTILFDLDGTLINTNEIIIQSFQYTFDTHFPEIKMDTDKILTFIGPTLQQTFGDYTKDPFLIQEMINSYRRYYIENEMGLFEIYPDVIEVVSTLKEEGYNLGIVTSKFKEAAWPSFTHYQLDELFDVFISLDEVEYPKPDRNPIDVALRQFDNPKGAIMIGDNKGDILAGKNAGIYSAGVAWSIKGSAHLMQAEPDFMLSEMKDIFKIINQIEEDQ